MEKKVSRRNTSCHEPPPVECARPQSPAALMAPDEFRRGMGLLVGGRMDDLAGQLRRTVRTLARYQDGSPVPDEVAQALVAAVARHAEEVADWLRENGRVGGGSGAEDNHPRG